MRLSVQMRLLLALIIAIAGLETRPCFSADGIQLRVLCYNVHHCEGTDRKLDVERIAKVIRSVKPDLVALQELDQNCRRSESVDQPAELARLTDMNVAFGPNISFQGGKYGNAILSRFSIQKQENKLLPNSDGGEQRGVIVSQLDLAPHAQRITFCATHFDHRSKDQQRLESAKMINKMARLSDQPTILAGDLNDVLGSRTLNELVNDHWSNTADKPMLTSPAKAPVRQIDFILFRPVRKWKVVQVNVLDEAIASDHRPIFAILELK